MSQSKFVEMLRCFPRYRELRPLPVMGPDRTGKPGGRRVVGPRDGKVYEVKFAEYELFVDKDGNLHDLVVRTNRLNPYTRNADEHGADQQSRERNIKALAKKGFVPVDVDEHGDPRDQRAPWERLDWFAQLEAEVGDRIKDAKQQRALWAKQVTDKRLYEQAAITAEALTEALHNANAKDRSNAGKQRTAPQG